MTCYLLHAAAGQLGCAGVLELHVLWLLTHDLAVHTDNTLARLRDDRVRCGPRSLFHGMRFPVAAPLGRACRC